jgi:2-polyprenyl-3-methyl-5-hydroxy-6-metoxy-1,4-benzoquinol methylase
MDVLGDAVLDYQKGNYTEDIITFSSLAEEDVMPLPYLFRNFSAMPILEQKALQLCKGKVLDIGCGAGSHSLFLQKKGFEVVALDNSKGAIETSKLRGVKNTIQADIYDFKNEKFDTLLLLMNGIGMVGTLNHLDQYFKHLKKLLHPGGQILLDSSDIIYMFEEDKDGGRWLPASSTYYGEVVFTMSYKGAKSMPFSWLYLDSNTLKNAANANHLNCEIVSVGEHFDYLARLTL